MKRITKKANVNFEFIARYPSAMLIAGGILMALIGQTLWAIILIGLGFIAHVIWLKR